MEKIKTLSIDLETFSDVDLAKCGVYRYVESPAFEILLFGVSVNGGDVVVYDLAQGEKIPAEILTALTDTSVIKWAFNATFERVCLSKYLGLPSGEYLDPTSWRCSMVWSAYMGLPLSLAGAGAVLGLSEQKLKEGKDLIKYFVEHRHDVVIRRTQYDLRKAKERAHILEGLIIASDNIDEVIKIIRAAKTPNDAISGLMERFELTEIQSRAIVEMRLRQLTGLMQDQLHALSLIHI